MQPATNGTATSNAAAESMRPHAATLRGDILNFISRYRLYGATAEEIEYQMDIPGNTVRPRLMELRELKKIKDSDKTRKTRSGRSAVVWVVA